MWESGVPAEFLGWVLVVSTVGGWCWPVRSRALVLCVACLGDLLSCAPSGELLTGPRGDLLSCAPSGELLMSPRAQGAGGGPQDGVVPPKMASSLLAWRASSPVSCRGRSGPTLLGWVTDGAS